MSKLIQWEKFESEYAEQFNNGIASQVKLFRMPLGELMIKERFSQSESPFTQGSIDRGFKVKIDLSVNSRE